MALNQKGINDFANTTLLRRARAKLRLEIVVVLHTWIILVAICFYYSLVNKEMEECFFLSSQYCDSK